MDFCARGNGLILESKSNVATGCARLEILFSLEFIGSFLCEMWSFWLSKKNAFLSVPDKEFQILKKEVVF